MLGNKSIVSAIKDMEMQDILKKLALMVSCAAYPDYQLLIWSDALKYSMKSPEKLRISRKDIDA